MLLLVILLRVNKKLGKNHSAKCIIYSFDFQEIEELQMKQNWEELRIRILAAGKSLKNSSAEAIILGCTEIGLLVKDYKTQLFESASIHAHAAVRKCLEECV